MDVEFPFPGSLISAVLIGLGLYTDGPALEHDHGLVRKLDQSQHLRVARRARIYGSWAFVSLNSMLQGNEEEEGMLRVQCAQCVMMRAQC